MALKDLASDLANFKYDQSSPDKIDNQIDKGVDFFDDTTGGAVGFKPKTNLESLYNKVAEGTIASKWPQAAVSNVKTRSAYGTFGEYGQNVTGNTGLSNPLHILSGDTILGVQNQPQFTSDFMTTPIANYNSTYSPPDTLSQTFTLASPNLQQPDFTSWMAFSSIGGGVNQFASLMPLVDRTSQFSTPEQNGVNNVYTTPLTDIQTTLNLPNVGGGVDTFDGLFSTLGLNTSQFTDKIDLFNLYESGDFTNVPGGLDANNLFSTTTFRDVANTGPHAGNTTHPIIVRPMGSNWDTSNSDLQIPDIPGTIDIGLNFGNTLDVGGLSFLTQGQRNIADKYRISKFMTSPIGDNFIRKQESLQLLNPTIESKFFKPQAMLGVAGADDITNFGLITNSLNRALSIVPTAHPERHTGDILGRYESVLALTAGVENIVGAFNPNFQEGAGSRLAYQARAFSIDIPPISDVTVTAFSNPLLNTLATSAVNFGIGIVNDAVSAAAASPFLALSNPNKYSPFPSSAPISIENGVPSFGIGTPQVFSDASKAQNKIGGTFNKETAESSPNVPDIKRHQQSAYGMLDINTSYEKRTAGKEIANQIGNPGKLGVEPKNGIKGDLKTSNVDKINALHYPFDYDGSPGGEVKDFIKFRFKDVVNNRFIIFRAILDGITDSVTPEYGEERYVGRPDKVYIYQGADRNVSFNFSIYPKTKQEFPILMGKLNHLIGLCYPSYTEQDMMVTPFIELTMGDMFVNSSGILMGLSVTVEDNSTWELDEGLQFPHYMKVACEFRHIGNGKLSSTSTQNYNGLEYDLPNSGAGSSLAIRRSNPLSPIDFGANIEPVTVPVLPNPNEESNIGLDDLGFL